MGFANDRSGPDLAPATSASHSPIFAAPATSVRTAVLGVSGYAGAELARILLNHPRLQNHTPVFLGRMDSAAKASQSLYDLHPQLARNDGKPAPQMRPFDAKDGWQQLQDLGTEVLFLATPHEQSREWVPHAVANGMRVIDLSGAWRLHDPANAAVYQLHDTDHAVAQQLQSEAVYGCPELHRAAIRTARLIANPGCYATSIILALAPFVQAGLIDLDHGIVCDSKSGVSGAGKAATAKTHFMYAADNFSAYSVFGHRHTGELLEQLHLTADQIQFTPHLLPIPRGILSTVYAQLNTPASYAGLDQILQAFYANSPMVRIHLKGSLPQIQHVARTSFCDIGFELDPNGNRLILVSCLDNLLKGAASQAVQNLNILCGFREEEGLL